MADGVAAHRKGGSDRPEWIAREAALRGAAVFQDREGFGNSFQERVKLAEDATVARAKLLRVLTDLADKTLGED